MTNRRPEPTHWRAIVQGTQIGLGYESKEQALQAAREYFDKVSDGSTPANIDARASFLPLKNFQPPPSKP